LIVDAQVIDHAGAKPLRARAREQIDRVIAEVIRVSGSVQTLAGRLQHTVDVDVDLVVSRLAFVEHYGQVVPDA
jgi:hypothetical protein